MKKNKIARIVALCLIISLGIAYLVLYLVNPELTQKYTWLTFDYICNKPLPVIGVSALVVGVIIFKLVRFILKHKGKKYDEIKAELEKIKKEDEIEIKELAHRIEMLKEELKGNIEYCNNEIDLVKGSVIKLCDTIPNKKVNKLGEKLYEPTNSSKETKTI